MNGGIVHMGGVVSTVRVLQQTLFVGFKCLDGHQSMSWCAATPAQPRTAIAPMSWRAAGPRPEEPLGKRPCRTIGGDQSIPLDAFAIQISEEARIAALCPVCNQAMPTCHPEVPKKGLVALSCGKPDCAGKALVQVQDIHPDLPANDRGELLMARLCELHNERESDEGV